MDQIGDSRNIPSSRTTGAVLTSASPGILTGGRKVTAEARGEATSGLATIKEREVGALFFREVRQGNVERGVDVIPMGGRCRPREGDAAVWLLRETVLVPCLTGLVSLVGDSPRVPLLNHMTPLQFEPKYPFLTIYYTK